MRAKLLKKGRIRIGWLAACLFWFSRLSVLAQCRTPEIIGFLPAAGPEGTRVEIVGKNLQDVSATLFGKNPAVFSLVSPEKLIVIVPHKLPTSIITVITPQGQGSSRSPSVGSNDPRIPDEASYKAGYVNPVPRPADFASARLWGMAIADTRAPGSESAQVEVAWTRLSCRVDGKEVVLNDDGGQVRGGLYRRQPWFGTDAHDPMPLAFDLTAHAAALHLGQRADRVWHFWRPSPRVALPAGRVEGCTVRARSKFIPAPCCSWGWTIGALRLSRTALAGIITKPALAIGIFPLRSGRKHRSPTSAARDSRNSAMEMEAGRPRPAGWAGRPSSTPPC